MAAYAEMLSCGRVSEQRGWGLVNQFEREVAAAVEDRDKAQELAELLERRDFWEVGEALAKTQDLGAGDGVRLPLLQPRAQEVGARPSGGRGFFPDETERAFWGYPSALLLLSGFERR